MTKQSTATAEGTMCEKTDKELAEERRPSRWHWTGVQRTVLARTAEMSEDNETHKRRLALRKFTLKALDKLVNGYAKEARANGHPVYVIRYKTQLGAHHTYALRLRRTLEKDTPLVTSDHVRSGDIVFHPRDEHADGVDVAFYGQASGVESVQHHRGPTLVCCVDKWFVESLSSPRVKNEGPLHRDELLHEHFIQFVNCCLHSTHKDRHANAYELAKDLWPDIKLMP